MEKAYGVPLKSRWMTLLEDVHAKRLAHSCVKLETKLCRMLFSAADSIYFKKDIVSEQQAPIYR
jgi:hypothetical protein